MFVGCDKKLSYFHSLGSAQSEDGTETELDERALTILPAMKRIKCNSTGLKVPLRNFVTNHLDFR